MHNDSLIMSCDTMAIHSFNMTILLPSEIDGLSNERVIDMNHFFQVRAARMLWIAEDSQPKM